MNNQYFNKALGNFIFDFAGGDTVRKLTRDGYSVTEISDKLLFPLTKKQIGMMSYRELVAIGRVRLQKPHIDETLQQISYIKEYDTFGKASLRQISTPIPIDASIEYVEINFGKLKYKNDEAFNEQLQKLSVRDKSYINDIPWPLSPVYHEKNEQIMRILDILASLRNSSSIQK